LPPAQHRPLMASVVGAALDDLVGAVLNKKEDAGFLSQVERQYLDNELSLLKTKVGQYRSNELKQTEELKVVDDRLQSELSNQREIFMYLNGELAKKTDEILELHERVQALSDESERQTLEHENKLLAQKDAFQLQHARLQEDNLKLKTDLDKVNKYIAEKDEMMEKLAFAERQLEEEGKAHARAIADLERKHVQEKDRLKKEMLHKLRETKANLLKLTDNQLDTTTKRTIAENEQMSSELAWQSKETEKLIKKNNQLVAEIGSLKLELSLNRQTESEMAKKVNAYQKTIQALMNKLSSMGAEQEAELLRRTALTEDADRERTESLNERAHLSQELEQAQALLAASQEEVARLREQLRDMEAKHANVLLLQDDAVKFTLQCLEDMRTKHLATSLSKLPTREASALASESTVYEDADRMGERRSLQSLDTAERESVLVYLLEQLQAYQQQLRELELHAAWRQHHATQPLAHGGSVTLPPISGQGASQGMAGFAAPVSQLPVGASLAPSNLAPAAGGSELIAVQGSVKPWGKRSASSKLTRHTPDAFLRRG